MMAPLWRTILDDSCKLTDGKKISPCMFYHDCDSVVVYIYLQVCYFHPNWGKKSLNLWNYTFYPFIECIETPFNNSYVISFIFLACSIVKLFQIMISLFLTNYNFKVASSTLLDWVILSLLD